MLLKTHFPSEDKAKSKVHSQLNEDVQPTHCNPTYSPTMIAWRPKPPSVQEGAKKRPWPLMSNMLRISLDAPNIDTVRSGAASMLQLQHHTLRISLDALKISLDAQHTDSNHQDKRRKQKRDEHHDRIASTAAFPQANQVELSNPFRVGLTLFVDYMELDDTIAMQRKNINMKSGPSSALAATR